MIKKALFILTSILIGFMLVTNGYYICFYNVFQNFTEEAVEAKDYEDAAKYYAYSFDYENVYKADMEDGTHIEFYSALNMYARDAVKEDETKVQYETLESTIQFALFHLPEEFALTDKTVSEGETPVKGGIELVYGDKKVFFEFMPSETESFYSYAEYYNFLPYTIHYADYVSRLEKEGIDVNSITSNILIYDGNNDTVYDLNVQKALFDTEFHAAYYDTITKYNDLKKADALSGETSEEATTLVETISKVADDKGFEKQHTVDVIFKSGAFYWRIGLMIGAFLVLDFLIGFLLFRKKKPSKFVPRKPMMSKPAINNGPKLNYQPEQFSRKDFIDAQEEVNEEVAEESVVEEIVEQTVSEDVKE